MKCFQIHVVVVQKVWFVGDLVHSSIMLIKIRTCSAPSFLSSSLILNIKCCPNFHDIFYHYNICSFIKSILGNHFLKQWNYLVNCMDLWYYIYPSQPIIFLFISLDILSISSLFWHLNDIERSHISGGILLTFTHTCRLFCFTEEASFSFWLSQFL